LPELVLIEGIQQVAMKRDESLSPSLFTFHSHFATIHRYYYYDFMTARGARLPWAQEARGSNPRAPTNIFADNNLQKGNLGTAAFWCNLGTTRKNSCRKIACELRVSNWKH
jgi:hypothetical protein